jgi:hypothetical protein
MRNANRLGASKGAAIFEDYADAHSRAIRRAIGKNLQERYGGILKEDMPPKIAELLRRLEDVNTEKMRDPASSTAVCNGPHRQE